MTGEVLVGVVAAVLAYFANVSFFRVRRNTNRASSPRVVGTYDTSYHIILLTVVQSRCQWTYSIGSWSSRVIFRALLVFIANT